MLPDHPIHLEVCLDESLDSSLTFGRKWRQKLKRERRYSHLKIDGQFCPYLSKNTQIGTEVFENSEWLSLNSIWASEMIYGVV